MVSKRISLIIALTALVHSYLLTSQIEAPSINQDIKQVEEPQPIAAEEHQLTVLPQGSIQQSVGINDVDSLEQEVDVIKPLVTDSSKNGVQENVADLIEDEENLEENFTAPIIKTSAQQDLGLNIQPQILKTDAVEINGSQAKVQPIIKDGQPIISRISEEQQKLIQSSQDLEAINLSESIGRLAMKEGINEINKSLPQENLITLDHNQVHGDIKTGLEKQSIPPLEEVDAVQENLSKEPKVGGAQENLNIDEENLPSIENFNQVKRVESVPIKNTMPPLIEKQDQKGNEVVEQINEEESSEDTPESEDSIQGIKNSKQHTKEPRFDASINVFSSDEEEPKKCKVEILKAFGMSQEKFFELSRPSKADTKLYCRRNSQTCCSAAHIQSLMEGFTKATNKLRKSFEPIEELFTLFRGKAYSNFISEASGDDICSIYVNEAMTMIGKDPAYFFDPEHTKMRTQEIFSVLVDLEFYIKRQIWFYGNMVCTVCNPNENEFFSFENKVPVIKALMNTCSDILETYEFEIRLIKLFNFFIKPIADIIKCKTEKLTDDEYALPLISNEELMKMEQRFHSCYSNFNEKNQACVEICSKSVTIFDTQLDFHTPLKEALKIIFKRLTRQEINDYYLNIKNENFEELIWAPINFFSPTWEKDSSYFKKVRWEFGNHGVNIYNNHVSKKFYNYQASRRKTTAF